jgi:hypothetical protein
MIIAANAIVGVITASQKCVTQHDFTGSMCLNPTAQQSLSSMSLSSLLMVDEALAGLRASTDDVAAAAAAEQVC